MDSMLPDSANPLPDTPPAVSRPMPAHNRPDNRYLITGELHLIHGLHIGSGRGDDRTDALVVVNGRNEPIIPGSSLRGALRSHTERLMSALHAAGSPFWACGLYESETPNDRICLGNLNHQRSESAYKELLKREENDPDVIWREMGRYICDACRLFGAGSVWASPLRFTDLPLRSGGDRQIRHGVGIHRDTGTAAPGIKYDREVVDAGSIFEFEAIAENLDAAGQAVLALALGQLMGGEISLGGSTGRGLGSCELRKATVYWVDMRQRDQLVAYLTAGPSATRQSKFPHSQPLADFVAAQLGQILLSETAGGDHAQTTG